MWQENAATASLSVCLLDLTNVSFIGTLNCLFRVMNKEKMLPDVVSLLLGVGQIVKSFGYVWNYNMLFGSKGLQNVSNSYHAQVPS